MISIGSGIAITSLNSVDRLIASDMDPLGKDLVFRTIDPVSYTHLTLPTTPYV